MIRLHQLVEDTVLGNINKIVSLDVDTVYNFNNALVARSKHLKCFQFGNLNLVQDIEGQPEFVLLPYSECWFEFNYTPPEKSTMFIGTMCYMNKKNRLEGVVYDVTPNKTPCILGIWQSSSEDEFRNTWIYPNDAELEDVIMGCRNAIFVFLTLLHSKNVKRVRTDPPVALQKSRVKKGKTALHTYWTLEIPVATKETILKIQRRMGIEGRKSPKWHTRIAHYRNLKSGRRVPVKPAEVGDKKNGTVTKDYAVKLIN